jgi:hypothetical protein
MIGRINHSLKSIRDGLDRAEEAMGAWGVGSFENDAAVDWVYELEASEDLAVIERALEAASESRAYVDAEVSAEAVGAAEVVAALLGRPDPGLPESIQAWVKSHSIRPDPNLIRLAIEAVESVAAASEEKDLWDETEHFDSWRTRMEDLKRRLQG